MALVQTTQLPAPPLGVQQPTRARKQTQEPNLRERKKARARETILTMACELIDARGYPETKMREIARAAEVSYQTLYNYFPTKALRLQELLIRAMPTTVGQKLARMPDGSDPLDATIELIQCYFDAISFCERHLWLEVATELVKTAEPERCLLSVIDGDSQHKLERLFADFQGSSKLDTRIDPRLMADTSHQLINSALLDYLTNTDQTRVDASERLIEQIRLVITPYVSG